MYLQHISRKLAQAVILLSSVALPIVARSQEPPALPGFTAFVIAVVDTFPYKNASAVIVRRPNVTPHDVILIKQAKVQPKWLAEAVHALQVARAMYGDVPPADGLFRVHDPGPTRRYDSDAREWAGVLANARPRDLAGIGTVRSMTLMLPNQRP